MTMTKGDIARLLAVAAAFDQRTVGQADVEAWFQVGQAGGWELSYATRAVIEHYEAESERLMPAHISRRIRERRTGYARSFLEPALPDGMHDVDEQIHWAQKQRRAFIQARMDRWAAGEDVAR